MHEFFKSHARKIVVGLSGVLSAASGYATWDHYQYVPVKTVLSKPEGTDVRVFMHVDQAKYLGPQSGTLLNVGKYPNVEATIRVPGKDAKEYVGKNVKVYGTLTSYQGKKQIEAIEIEAK